MTITAGNVDGLSLARPRGLRAHEACAGVAVNASHARPMVKVGRSVFHESAVFETRQLGASSRSRGRAVHFGESGVAQRDTRGSRVTPETATVFDFRSEHGMGIGGVTVEVAGQAATTPREADIQPVLALLVAKVTTCTQLAQQGICGASGKRLKRRRVARGRVTIERPPRELYHVGAPVHEAGRNRGHLSRMTVATSAFRPAEIARERDQILVRPRQAFRIAVPGMALGTGVRLEVVMSREAVIHFRVALAAKFRRDAAVTRGDQQSRQQD